MGFHNPVGAFRRKAVYTNETYLVRNSGNTTKLVEVLADYQFMKDNGDGTYVSGGENGLGFLRLMKFHDDKLSVQTYSPVLNKYNVFTDGSDEYEIPLPLVESQRSISTDSFSASLLND